MDQNWFYPEKECEGRFRFGKSSLVRFELSNVGEQTSARGRNRLKHSVNCSGQWIQRMNHDKPVSTVKFWKPGVSPMDNRFWEHDLVEETSMVYGYESWVIKLIASYSSSVRDRSWNASTAEASSHSGNHQSLPSRWAQYCAASSAAMPWKSSEVRGIVLPIQVWNRVRQHNKLPKP